MKNQNFDVTAVEILDQAENILQDASIDLSIETRIDETLEILDTIKFEQASINLIDRIRNTDDSVIIHINSSAFPVVTANVCFTSENYLVAQTKVAQFLVNLSHVKFFSQVDSLAVFRNSHSDIDTTVMWIKNLIDQQRVVTAYLIGETQLAGTIVRFSHDHLDLLTRSLNVLVPFSSIILIRSSNEN